MRAGSAACSRASATVTQNPSEARSGAVKTPTWPAPSTSACVAGWSGSMRTSTDPPQHIPSDAPRSGGSTASVTSTSTGGGTPSSGTTIPHKCEGAEPDGICNEQIDPQTGKPIEGCDCIDCATSAFCNADQCLDDMMCTQDDA